MVPLNPFTATALTAYGVPRRGPVFTGACEHQCIRPGTVTKYISRYLDSLGIAATGHHLRHWFGTETYRRSRDLRLVQELLGHASVGTAQGYVGVDRGAAVEVVNGLGTDGHGSVSQNGREGDREWS